MSLRNSKNSKKGKSMCKGLIKEECIKLNECKYTNGIKRNFCRLKTNKLRKGKKMNLSVRMNEEEKDDFFTPLSVLPPKLKEKAKPKTKRILKLSKKTIEERKMNEMKNEKAKMIQRFMKQTKNKRKAEFLKAVCSDAGECLAFGNYTSEIKKHFGGFAKFEYAIAPITRIGSPSANGFINQIQYKHRGYKAYAVLKSSVRPGSDNLMYEYMVGQYVNKLNKRYPCFVETYGYYIYDTDLKINNKTVWSFLKDSKVTANMDTIKKGLILQKTTDYAKACKQSKFLAILIQHLKGIIPIRDRFRSPRFVTYELANVLFQIYMPFAMIASSFTHYDLHHENVNVYEPESDSYIQFHYYGKDQQISFKSKYIAKVIDYGRSYFKDDESGITSKKIYTELCKEEKCTPSCGSGKGFSWMADYKYSSESYWISSQRRNASHDLRLLNEVRIGLQKNQTEQYLSSGLKKLLQDVKYDKHYGTPEMQDSGYPNKIHHIIDAAFRLKTILSLPGQIQQNEDIYRGKTKLGDLHVYCIKGDTRPMRFVKA